MHSCPYAHDIFPQIVCIKLTSLQEQLYEYYIKSKAVKMLSDAGKRSAQCLQSINALKKVNSAVSRLAMPEHLYCDTRLYGCLRSWIHLLFFSAVQSPKTHL